LREVGDFVFGAGHRQADVEIAIVDAARLGCKYGDWVESLAAHEVAGKRGDEKSNRSEQEKLHAEIRQNRQRFVESQASLHGVANTANRNRFDECAD
jgi:hypothetical protein